MEVTSEFLKKKNKLNTSLNHIKQSPMLIIIRKETLKGIAND